MSADYTKTVEKSLNMTDFINPAGLVPERRIPCSTLELVQAGNLWAVNIGGKRIGLFRTQVEALKAYPKCFVPEPENDEHSRQLGIGA